MQSSVTHRSNGAALGAPRTTSDLPERIVFFDGECAVCDRSVQWLLERHGAAELCFAPLQGTTAAHLRHRFPDFPSDIDTAVLYERRGTAETLWLRSRAVFRIAALLGGAWRAVGMLGVLPRIFTDPAYRAFAAVRYRLFGKLESCRIPAPEEQHLFLD